MGKACYFYYNSKVIFSSADVRSGLELKGIKISIIIMITLKWLWVKNFLIIFFIDLFERPLKILRKKLLPSVNICFRFFQSLRKFEKTYEKKTAPFVPL